MRALTDNLNRPKRFLVAWLLLTLAALLTACTSAMQAPPPTPTGPPTNPPPASVTPLPPTSTLTPTRTAPPPTRTATPLLSSTATQPWVPTPFPKSLEAFYLTYNPAATLDLPPKGSLSLLFWGEEIPVQPVDATPVFIPYPTPMGMEGSADALTGFGCELSVGGWATCPPDNPLQRFGCTVLTDPGGIGYGLEPDLPLVAICKIQTEEYEAAKINGLYLTGCAFVTENQYIFETDGQYILVSSQDELKQRFAPIDSPEEAISYAQLATGLDAVYSFDYDPTLMYFHETITATHAIPSGDGFEVNLFYQQGCGCEPWFTNQIPLRVDRTGRITWGKAIPVFMTTGFGCAD